MWMDLCKLKDASNEIILVRYIWVRMCVQRDKNGIHIYINRLGTYLDLRCNSDIILFDRTLIQNKMKKRGNFSATFSHMFF